MTSDVSLDWTSRCARGKRPFATALDANVTAATTTQARRPKRRRSSMPTDGGSTFLLVARRVRSTPHISSSKNRLPESPSAQSIRQEWHDPTFGSRRERNRPLQQFHELERDSRLTIRARLFGNSLPEVKPDDRRQVSKRGTLPMTQSTRARRLFHLSILPLGVAFLAACSSEDHRPRSPGGREGELAVYNATLEDGTNERRFFLRRGEEETRLVFSDQAPDVSPGTAIEVWGKDQDDGLHVTRLEANATVGTATESLIGGMAYTPRKFAFIFVDIGGGVNLTADEARKRLFGTNTGDNSVKQYYLEASYNTQDISGDIYGPIKYSMSGCGTSALASALKGMIPMSDHYLWYLGSRNSSCGW